MPLETDSLRPIYSQEHRAAPDNGKGTVWHQAIFPQHLRRSPRSGEIADPQRSPPVSDDKIIGRI